MSLYYLLNPKQFIDPMWFTPGGGGAYKKITTKIETEARESTPCTLELTAKISDIEETTQKIDQINQEMRLLALEDARLIWLQLELDRIELFKERIARQVLLMQEEEELMLLLLMLD